MSGPEEGAGNAIVVRRIGATDAAATARLMAGVTRDDLALAHSHDGQCLLHRCGVEVLAICGAISGSAETIESDDGTPSPRAGSKSRRGAICLATGGPK